MKSKFLYITIFSFCLTSLGYAQNFPKSGYQQQASLEFNNYDYKVTWIIQDGKYGLLDTRTKTFIIPPIYDDAEMYHADYSLVKKNGKYGFINHDGEMITKFEYTTAQHHNDKLVLVQKEDKFTFLDKNILSGRHFDFAGNIEFEEEYDMVISSYTDNYSIVMTGGRYGYIDENGEQVIPLMYEEVTIFNGQFAAVKIDNKWGAIDRSNGKMIDFKYQKMRPFDENNTVVKKGKKWGIIDIQEKAILPIKYKHISNFNTDKVALAKKGKSWGLINQKGKTLIDFEYDLDENYIDLLQITDGYVWLKKDGLWGTVDLNHNIIIPFKYSEIQEVNGNEITVVEQGEVRIIDEFGECLKNCVEKTRGVYYDFDN
ncbi:MAG: WG repeat-containing protein [Saprospiraceae bacterium]